MTAAPQPRTMTTTPRFNARAAAVTIVAFLSGVLIFVAAKGFVRSFVSDVVVVVFLVAALGTARLGTTRSRLIGVGLFALSAELLQGAKLVGPGSHWLLHATVGSTFDALDLVAYSVGLILSVGAERWTRRG